MQKIDKNEILNQVKICAMSYPMKALADDLHKPYSTLSNELDHREYAKLGLLTFLGIVELSQGCDVSDQCRSAGLAAIDLIEEGLGRIGYRKKGPVGMDQAVGVMKMMSKIAKEYADTVQALAFSIEDGELNPGELELCIKENQDLLKASLEADAYLRALKKNKKPGRIERCARVAA